jgi:beta-xylosidase
MRTSSTLCRFVAGRAIAPVLALGLAVLAIGSLHSSAQEREPQAYLFAYFTGNGEDGLHFASSVDGLAWTALNGGRSYLTPAVGTKLMRDPCVMRGPDGVYHMVWTTGWWDKGIGVAHSKDLVEWSEQQFVPVMAHEAGAVNAWAPEIVYDAAAAHYVIFWSTTIPGRFPDTDQTGSPLKQGGRTNHRIYRVTTKDFRTYTPAALFYDDGFNVIDATIVEDGRRVAMIVKDETEFPTAKKHLRVALADRLAGPYGHASAPISIDWVEGPSVLKVGETWLLYFDEYTRHKYGALRSRDLVTWQPVTEAVTFPAGTRHGTAFAVPPAVLTRLSAGGR